MSQVANQILRGGVDALTLTSGVPILRDQNNQCALLGTPVTYLFPIGDADSLQKSAHFWADANFAGTITVEVSDFPVGKADAEDTTDYSNDAGSWLKWNPTAAVVAVSTGSVATAATVVVTAGQITGAMFFLPDWGPRRARLKVVCTTGGKVRVCWSGKD